MVIGKTTAMYETLFETYFSSAAASGLVAPAGSGSQSGGSTGGRRKTPFVSITMDFETAQHNGFFLAMSRVFGGQPSYYCGRAIGCGVHYKRFLLPLVGNNVRDQFFLRMMAIREAESEGGLDAVRRSLEDLKLECVNAGQTDRASVIQWLLRTRAALLAAFPKASGALGRTELLASSNDTYCCESLNRQTKQVINESGARTLLEVIEALSDFDKRKMLATSVGPNATTHVNDQAARMAEGIKRKQKTNAVPKRGQPPKTTGKKRKRPASGAPGSTPPPPPARPHARSADSPAGVGARQLLWPAGGPADGGAPHAVQGLLGSPTGGGRRGELASTVAVRVTCCLV